MPSRSESICVLDKEQKHRNRNGSSARGVELHEIDAASLLNACDNLHAASSPRTPACAALFPLVSSPSRIGCRGASKLEAGICLELTRGSGWYRNAELTEAANDASRSPSAATTPTWCGRNSRSTRPPPATNGSISTAACGSASRTTSSIGVKARPAGSRRCSSMPGRRRASSLWVKDQFPCSIYPGYSYSGGGEEPAPGGRPNMRCAAETRSARADPRAKAAA